MDIQPGKYAAKIVDYGVSTTKSGEPTIVIRFGWDNKSLIWNGSLKDGKAQEITLKTLVRLGLSDDDKIENLADGIESGLLDTKQEFEIDVQMDTYEGKTRPRIAWVNLIGGSGFRHSMNKDEFKVKIGGMNLKGSIKALRKELGMAPRSESITLPDMDLPF